MSSCFAVRRASSGGEEEETGGIGEAKGAHDTYYAAARSTRFSGGERK